MSLIPGSVYDLGGKNFTLAGINSQDEFYIRLSDLVSPNLDLLGKKNGQKILLLKLMLE